MKIHLYSYILGALWHIISWQVGLKDLSEDEVVQTVYKKKKVITLNNTVKRS